MTNVELDAAWSRLLALADHRRRHPSNAAHRRAAIEALCADAEAEAEAEAEAVIADDSRSRSDGVEAIRLYAPLLQGDSPFAIGHLGQSIDGCIATASGHSLYVTGEQNLVHLHRLRALCDAVLVGAGTAVTDDPRLTVRHVEGPSPVRIVIDARASVPASLGLFSDGGPDTLIVTAQGGGATAARPERCIGVPQVDGRLSPPAIRDALVRRGLSCLFIEGGGVTVSQWLEAGALDRLHVAVAPVIIGDGRRGLSLPSAVDMPSARRPPATLHRMGEDVLFDFDTGAQASATG